MKVPLSWLREFVGVPDDVRQVATKLSESGFELAAIDGDVIDFEITANRPDCLSVYGLAREAAVAFDVELKAYPGPPGPKGPSGPSGSIPVSIESPLCGRYALGIADVKIGPSPAWLAQRLVAAGVRPINNIVDATNYVMVEMGHPTHAFDAAKLAGPEIRVRLAQAGERIMTLDGQQRTLDPGMLIIADRDRPVAIAGVMGGAESEVSQTTKRIALESAWFQPASVRKTSRRLSLKTEASARFERGADIDAPVRAINRAVQLLEQIGAGRAAAPIVDEYPTPHQAQAVTLRRERVGRLLGEEVPDNEIERILTRLGLQLSPTRDGWQANVPSFRVDVTREADLIEEVGRHWGFDRIPATFPALREAPRPLDPGVRLERRLREVLCGAGLQEAVTFTFIDEAAAKFYRAGAVQIANPLSEKFAAMRPSLLPGLLDAVIYNRHRQIERVRIFELGAVFSPAGERRMVAWMLAGPRDDHWSTASEPVDFFDAKGISELLAGALGSSVTARAEPMSYFTPGRAAALDLALTAGSPREVGRIGEIASGHAVLRGLNQPTPIVAGELDLTALAGVETTSIAPVAALPRFPSVVRDLSIVIDQRLPAEAVRGTIHAAAPETLVTSRVFDRYQGKGVPPGQVSLSVRLTFRAADRTLTDHEVQMAVDAIVAALAREHEATLRGQ